ncbi:hypothetical protein NQ315_014166, partial [Exocentrus adspersus]
NHLRKKNIQKCRVKSDEATFERNFDFIERTLKTAHDELGSNGNYDSFLEVVKALQKAKEERDCIKQELKEKRGDLKKLEYTLYEEENLYHKKIAETMSDIGKIKDEIEDFLIENEMKLEYVENWQQSKIETNEILLQKKEEVKMVELKKIDVNTYREARVHQEILAAYSEMEKDTFSEIGNWAEKYDRDYKELEKRIQTLKEEREKQNEAMLTLRKTYMKRQKEMDDYKLYKIQEEEKKIELKKRNDAATKIQAWWKGTMVRKGFGKFRKKKDKKGKKK